MYCSRCGTELGDESRFCKSCGLDVTQVSDKPIPEAEPDVNELDIVRDALKDDYEILDELGRGGMAIVYRAREKQLEREVALKVLPSSLSFDAEFVERFQREARTAAKLEHPNIIPIYRVGKSGRVIYFTMKFLRGKSLSDLIEDKKGLSVSEIRRLLGETASALGYAHKHHIVHRDIKPDNILLDDSGHAIVTDFGIAKAATGSRLTGTGMAIGTPHYMSPEQARAQPLDGRSDIYSLGVVTYQCLAGKVPFDAEDAFSIGYKHITEEVPTPVLGGMEEHALFDVVKRMLEKDPEQRFQTAGDLLVALEGGVEASAESISTRATTPIKVSAKELAQATSPASSETPTTPMPRADLPTAAGESAKMGGKKKRGAGALVAAALLLAVGGGGGGYFYYVNVMGGMDVLGIFGGEPSEPVANTNNLNTTGPVGVLSDTTTVASDSGVNAEALDTATAVAPPVEPAEPTTGVLILSGVPGNGRVRIDGVNRRGLTHELRPGSHRLVVTAQGRQNFSRSVNVGVGDTTRVRVQMPAVRAQASCTQYVRESYNRNGECFDVPPRANDAPLIRLSADFPGTPAPVVLLVKVSSSGQAVEVGPAQPPQDPGFYVLAVQVAQQMSYTPAQKGGRPVESYVEIQFSAFR